MRHTGHFRQRSPDSWEIRYSLGTDPATGKRRIATTTVRGTRKDAEKELRRLLRALDTGEHVDPSRVTVRQWLTTWLDSIRQEVAPKTAERYGEIVHNFLVPKLGNLQLAKLAPVHLQDAYSAWATSGRRDGKPGGLSPQTRRHIHRILSTASVRAVEQQLIARNPCDAFKKRLPKVERREMMTLTAEQAQRLFDVIRHRRIYWARSDRACHRYAARRDPGTSMAQCQLEFRRCSGCRELGANQGRVTVQGAEDRSRSIRSPPELCGRGA